LPLHAHALTPAPAAARNSYSVLREGKAEVLQRDNDVFYNKAQVRRAAAPRAARARLPHRGGG
jgi:hypothetical protein